MNEGPKARPAASPSRIEDRESMFDKRSLFIGAGLAVLLLTVAAVWSVTYREKPQKTGKLRDFEFSPRPPDVDKLDVKDPQPTMMKELVQERPDFDDKPSSPNIMMTTEIRDAALPTEVAKTHTIEVNTDVPVKISRMDLRDTVEKFDELASETVTRLTPIAVSVTGAGDIYKYSEPVPRASPNARLMSTSPRQATSLKITLPKIDDLEGVAVGELGPLDLNMIGNGGDWGGTGRGGRPMSETRTAVDLALRWLHLHQNANGSWAANYWDPEGAPFSMAGLSTNVGPTDVGISAMACLALMGGGNTLRKGEYRGTVLRGIQWLISQQDERTGYFSRNMYCHALATIALCEAVGRSPDERAALAARKAVEACVAGVAKDGGWRYAPNSEDSDMSVTSWFLQALKTAKMANIKFDHSVFSRGLAYMDQCTDRGALGDSNGRVAYGYNPGLIVNEGSPPLTCAGMVIRQFNGMGVNHPVLVRAAEATKAGPPSWANKKFYYWYYATYAMHNMGGEYRLWWNSRIRDVLLDNQTKRGHQAGSWNPKDADWAAGRVYCTALGALCLEVYYRYDAALTSFGTVPSLDELTFQ